MQLQSNTHKHSAIRKGAGFILPPPHNSTIYRYFSPGNVDATTIKGNHDCPCFSEFDVGHCAVDDSVQKYVQEGELRRQNCHKTWHRISLPQKRVQMKLRPLRTEGSCTKRQEPAEEKTGIWNLHHGEKTKKWWCFYWPKG